MKKYKLIKEYPASPPLNSIAEINDTNALYCLVLNGKLNNEFIYSSTFGRINVENYPEYWEEIIEKDYEILSFTRKYTKDLWLPWRYNNGKNYWSKCGHITSPYTMEEILVDTNYSIHSVKRLSDGEIFTIGDRIELGYFEKSESEITGFEIDVYNDLYVYNKTSKTVPRLFKLISKVKQPLFVTEDGVDIFENDIFYHVDPFWAIGSGRATENPFKKLKGYKEFSTKEKAQEYIDLHKPKYSLNDVKEAYQRGQFITVYDILNNLIALNK